jgi:hypothetical protein
MREPGVDERMQKAIADAGRRHRPQPGWQGRVWEAIDAGAGLARASSLWPPAWLLAAIGAMSIVLGGFGGGAAWWLTHDERVEVVSWQDGVIVDEVAGEVDVGNTTNAPPSYEPPLRLQRNDAAHLHELEERARQREAERQRAEAAEAPERAKPITKPRSGPACRYEDPLCGAAGGGVVETLK